MLYAKLKELVNRRGCCKVKVPFIYPLCNRMQAHSASRSNPPV